MAFLVSAIVLSTGMLVPAEVSASTNYAPSLLSDSPQGYWRLGETTGTNAADASGHSNALTYAGGYTLGVAGAIVGDSNTAVQFNGSTATANRTSSPVTATTNWTLEAWVNPASISQAGVMVYNGKEDTSDGGYGFAISSATNLSANGSALVGAVNGAAVNSGYTFANANTWYHVAMTRDTTTIRFYVNGRITSLTSTTAPTAPSGRFSVGSGVNNAGSVVQPFNGAVDEAAIYSTALSAGRIAAHYQEGSQAIGGLGQWASFTPTISGGTLTARSDVAIAYDASHSKVVMFGGKNNAGTALNETWTYDPATNTWTKLTPAHSPSIRWGARIAYDAARSNVVLYGGTSAANSGYLSDTWTWNGTDWTQKSPGTVPPSRADPGMAYDAARNLVVIFGGNGGNNGSTYYGTTYTWNGTTWTLASSAGVSARSGVAMAFDSNNAKVVLFGGYTGSTYLSDTYTWNGTAWSTTSPGTSPSVRKLAGAAFDPIVGKIVLFGGYNGTTYQADTWTWDNTNWALQNSSTNPAARSVGGFLWNPQKTIQQFGGVNSSGALVDNWYWTTPPSAATNVTGTPGDTQVSVSWTAPADGGSTITQYLVKASPGGATATSNGSPAPTNATVTGLTNGTAYTFTVVATNGIGTGVTSAASAPVTPSTVPGAPTNASATPGDSQATVSWSAPASNGGSAITRYTITGSPGGSATLNCACTPPLQQTVTGLTNGTAYTFTVKATNSAGDSAQSTPSLPITVGAPTAPQSPNAVAGANQASVSWTAPASSNGSAITGYAVTAYLGAQAQNHMSTGPSTTSVNVNGLTGSSQYTFQIVASNARGSSPAAVTNAVTPSGSTSTYFATVRGDSPTAYWRLDDPSGSVVADSSGNAHDGSYVGSVGYSAASLIPSDPDPAVATDGSSGNYTSASSLTALQGDNTRSVEMWFKTTSPNPQALFDSGGCCVTGQVFDLFLNSPNLYGSPPHNTAGLDLALWGDDVYLPDLNLRDGNFHHVVVTLSGSTVYIYVDGRTPQGTVWNGSSWTALANQPFTLPTTPNTPAGAIFIGASHGAAGVNFAGTIDEVAVYSTALTATQVQNHDQAAQATLAAPVIGTVTAGSNQVTVTWTDASNPMAFTGYVVTAYSGSTATVSKAVSPSATTATLTGLMGGTPYTIKVSLTNAFSSFSATSSSVTPTGASSTYASTVQTTTPQPVLYYRLGDSGTNIAADSSGNGQTGTYVGTPTLGAGGALANDSDTSVTFGAGTVSYSGTNLPIGNAPRSVELWLKTTSTANMSLIQWGDFNNGGTAFNVQIQYGNQIWINLNNGTNPAINVPYSLANGQWHHLTLTFDGSTFVVYVDGHFANSQPYGSINTDRNLLTIGNGFQGSLDEVAVYSGVLISGQANTHFLASGNSQPAPPATVTATAGANAATVTWTASPTNPYPVLSYIVTAYNGTQAVNAQATGPSATSATISGLQSGLAYTFAVAGINNFGPGTVTSSTAVTPSGSVSAPYASTVIGSGPTGTGPVVYWRLGDNSGSPYAADSSGSGGWATYNAGTTLGASGALPTDSDASISGSLVYNTGAGLPTGNASRSVELWVKTTSTSQQSLVHWGSQNPYNNFDLQLNNDRVVIGLWLNPDPGINAPYTLANGQWHFLAVTFNGSLLTVYVDGSSIGSWSGTLATTQSGLLLGGNGFSGNLDEVAVYTRSLSPSEVNAHFLASGNSQPPALDSVGATAANNQATITWAWHNNITPPGLTGYLVSAYAGTAQAESVGVSASRLSVVMTGLQGGVSYTFRVAAFNNFGLGAATTSAPVTPTGSPSTFTSTVAGSLPLAYYRLGDSSGLAADSSGDGLLGNYTGTYTLGVQGALTGDSDSAMSGGGLQVNQTQNFPTGAAARTVEVWFKTTNTAQQNLAAYGDGNAGGTNFVWQLLAGGTQLRLNSTTSGWTFTAPYNVADGQWHMADVIYDGINLTMYVDSNSLGSQSAALSTDPGTHFVAGAFNGSLDELSVYSRVLNATDVSSHWQAAGAGVPGAPTNVTALAASNSAVVKWTPPAPRGGAVTSFTITPKVPGGASLASLSVTASTTSANVPGLPSGVLISFAVGANNKYGTGPAGISPAVTILGPQPAPNLDRSLAIAEAGNVEYGIYYDGWVSNNQIAASSLGQWTIEGWIWAYGSQNTLTGNMAWGLLNTTMFTDPNGDDHTVPSWDTPQAGINFNNGDLHGLNNCCDVSFVWPHNGNTQFGTNGKFTPPSNQPGDNQLGAILTSGAPVYIALDYDGTNVRGYINGSQSFSIADNAAIPASAWAGFFDESELRTGAFDGFRVSNIARYTATTFSVPTSDLSADANTLVDYNFNNYPVGMLQSQELSWHNPWAPIRWGYFPDSSTQGNAATFMAFSFPWQIGSSAYSDMLLQPFELSGGITPNELADECNGVNTGSGDFCQRSTDLTMPGRGAALALTRTYNSYSHWAQGFSFGYGWSSNYDAHLAFDGLGDVTVYDALGGYEFYQGLGGGSFATSSYVPTTLTVSGSNYVLADKGGGKLVFNSAGQLIQEIDRNAYATTLDWTGGQLTVTEPAGRHFIFSFGTNGLVSSVTDGTRMVNYVYDGNLNLTSVTDVLGGTTSYTYDSAHRLLTIKGPVCNVTQGCNGTVNVYDGSGRVGQQTDPIGNSASYSYLSSWPTFTTTVTDPLGHQTKYDYALGIPIDVIQAANTSLAAKTTFAFDPASMGIAAVTNANSETTTASYGVRGDRLTGTDPLGNTITYTYNNFSEQLSVQDPMGLTVNSTYDTNGTLLNTSTPFAGGPQVVTYTYGDPTRQGDVTGETDPTNRSVTYTYDSYGDLASSTDQLGNKTTYAYDSLGRMTSTVSPLGNVVGGNPAAYTTTFTYNNAREPLTITDPLSHQVVNQYNVGGLLTQTTDADGNVSKFSYDLDGRSTSSTAGYGTPQATTGQISYDALGNVLTETDGLNHGLVSYTYDPLNRQSTAADGMTHTTTYTYDSADHLISDVNPLGQTTSYSYNSGGWLTGTSYTDGSPAESFTYDADGQLLSMVDASGTTTNIFDSLHRLTQRTDGAGHVVGYGYDLANRVTSITYPGGNCSTPVLCVTRQYDNAGRLASIQDWLSHTTTFAYDANSNMTNVTYPNGVVATWTYDNADQLASIIDVNAVNTIVLNLAYTRDNNAQVTGENSTAFAYNSLNQVSSAGALGYTYDAAGRLTQTVNGSTTTNYSYDNADELLSAAVVGGTTTPFSTDAAGRRISAGSINLTWNQQDRLLTYGSGNSYTYDATGLRTSKTVAGQSQAFAWDTADGLPLLIQDGSTSYVAGPGGLPLEQITGSTVIYYQQDQLGSTGALTDASGAAVASYTYDAYGNVITQTGSASNPFLFSGEYQDAESGLYYLRARYYDPTTGQFLSRDPELSSTWEPYGYVADNPLNATDASGMALGFGTSSNGAWDFFRDNASSTIGGTLRFIGDQYMAFADWVNTKCPPLGRFLYGFGAGFTLNVDANSDPWYRAGQILGLFVALCPLDALGALGTMLLLNRAARAFKAVLLTERGAGVGADLRGLRTVSGGAPLSIEDILQDPELLRGRGPGSVRAELGQLPEGWQEERLGQGTHKGLGWLLRERTPRGDTTDRLIYWHPGGGQHGADPYWRVATGRGGRTKVPAGADDR